MSIKKIDCQFIVAEGFRALESTSYGVQEMMSSPVFSLKPPRTITKAKANYVSKTKTEEGKATTKEIIYGTRLAMNMVLDIASVIRGRGKNYVMKVDQTKQPDLYRAGQVLFGSNFDGTITFAMYEATISYLSQITQQLGSLPSGVPSVGDII